MLDSHFALPPPHARPRKALSPLQTPSAPPRSSGIRLDPEIPLCQTDLPLDWYQEEFKPYAEEYLALPDRLPGTVLPWLDRYAQPALDHFGDSLLMVAHYYMGGEIVKLVERYGGRVADSYQLALQAVRASREEGHRRVGRALHGRGDRDPRQSGPVGLDHQSQGRLHDGNAGQGLDGAAGRRSDDRALR